MSHSSHGGGASPADDPQRATGATPGRRRRWLPIAIGGGAGVLLVGLGAVGFLVVPGLMASSTEETLAEVVGSKLPGNTSIVAKAPIDESDLFVEAPPQFEASRLAAQVCGATDVAQLLARAIGREPEELMSTGIYDLSTTGAVADGIRCGEYVRAYLTRPSVVTSMFTEAERLGAVTIFWSRIEDFPGEVMRHNFSGLAGFCEPLEASDQCAPDGRAGFHDGHMWIVGPIASVKAFARAHTTAAEAPTTNVEILRTLAAGLERSDVAMLMPRPESVPWTAPCNNVAPVGHQNEFASECFPERQERVTESIETKLRGLALQRDRLATDWAIRWVFNLLARDEDAATDIERDLADLLRDWRAHLANSEPAMVRMFQRESDYVHDDLWGEGLPAFVRAIQQAEIERDGALVRLRIEADLTDAEIQLVRELMGTRTAVREAIARIVDAMIQQERLSEESLAVFVGEELASYVAAPRATPEDCAGLRTKLGELAGDDLPPEMFGQKFRLERGLADERCVESPLPEGASACFHGAHDLEAFEACRARLPRSPAEVRVLSRLRGQWRQSGFGSAGNWRLRRLLEGARIEMDDGRVALELSGEAETAPMALEAQSPARAEVQMAIPGGERLRAPVSVLGDDRISVTLDGMAVVFTRGSWDGSLLDAGNGG